MHSISQIIRICSLLAVMLAGSISMSALDFTLLTDTHVTPGNANEKKLVEAISEINDNSSEFVILSGDLTNEGSDEELFNIKHILDSLKKPLYVIPGNHENNWSQSALKTFNDIWGTDRFVFEKDSLIFIGINCGPYMKMGDGHIKQEDLIWLDKELATRCTPGKRVVSVNHYPIQSDLDNWQDYVSILQKYPTIIHICGHYHTSKQYKSGDIDAVMCRALDMTGKQDGYGYTNFTITTDSIFLYDKRIGESEERIMSIAAKATHPAYKYQTVEEFPQPEDFTIQKVFQDNASIFTRLGIDDSRIYFGNSLGKAKAIDKSSGKEIWEFPTNASLFSRPAVTDEYLIVPTADKRIIWADKATGRIIRENPSDGPYVADGTVVNNKLYQGGYKKFECWDVVTGNRIWAYNGLTNYCQAAPVVDGDDVIFGAWDTYLRCLDRKTGELKWKWNNGRNANMLGPGNCVPVVTDTRVFIVAPDRYMTVLDRKTGTVIWRSNFDGKYRVRESLGCSLDKKYVFAKTMDGQMVAVRTDSDTAQIAFAVDAQIGYEHAPCIVVESNDGTVFMGSRNGILVAIDPKTQSLKWRYRLGSSEFNGFEIDKNGDIYVSLIEGAIWKISHK